MSQFHNEAAQLQTVLEELQLNANFKPGNLIVIGCSSSEIAGYRIGSATNIEVAMAILPVILEWAQQSGLLIAVQCCEHLNRCLIVEQACAKQYGLEEVNVIPYLKGGGALAAAAMELFAAPVVVESLQHQAHGGVDIGNTFIGMHLRRVAVCVRPSIKNIGAAQISCVKTRPLLIGGSRAKHHEI